MSTWIVIAAVAAGTYALRAGMFVALGSRALPGWTARPMALVGPAAIAALVASSLAARGDELVTPAAGELLAVVAGGLAVRRTGNVMHAFAAGMPVLWAATALGV